MYWKAIVTYEKKQLKLVLVPAKELFNSANDAMGSECISIKFTMILPCEGFC